ncbi:MAG: hypothetical protein AAF581_02465 [Planctomycetota bacterium]
MAAPDAPQLEQLLLRGQRRQLVRRTLAAFRWGLLIAAASALVAVVYERLLAPAWFDYAWVPWLLLGVPALSALIGLAIALPRRRSVDAALEIESRYPLRERFSTLLLIPDDAISAETRHALAGDGEAHVNAVELPRAIPIRWGKGWLPSLVVLAFLGGVHLWLPAFDLLGAEEERRVEEARSERVKERKKEVQKRLEAIRKIAEREKVSPETRKLLAKMQKRDEERRKQPATGDAERDKKKALADMREMRSGIEARKKTIDAKLQRVEKLAGQIRQSTEKAKTEIGKKVESALAKGDLEAAAKAVQELAKQLNKTGLTEADKKALAKDLQKLMKDMKDLPGLGKKMEAMAKALEKLPTSELDKLTSGMEDAAKQLSQLQRLMRERDLLDQAAGEIEMTEDELASLPREWPEAEEGECEECAQKGEP